MTRRFEGRVHCPHCGSSHTAETAFERWMRQQPDLDSHKGIVRFDCDVLIHRYLTLRDKRGIRDIQAIMFVEVKTNAATMLPAQQDTLSILAQTLRNRRPNRHHHKRGRHLKDHTPLAKAYSHILKRPIVLRLFGGHLLRLSGDAPDTSEWMEWDGKRIDRQMLVDLLAMERDPDTLKRHDWRRRYSAFKTGQKRLFDS